MFTVKHKTDVSIERYKTILLPKDFTKTYGIDYEGTFALIAKNSIQVLFSLAAYLDWLLHQFDLNNAFLHGDLEEV